MNILIAASLVVFSIAGLALPQTPVLQVDDLRRLTGTQWTGSLTYTDYRSNKKVSIPSNLIVTQVAGDEMSWVFAYEYPHEPKANSKHTLTITEGGTRVDGRQVIERILLDADTIRIVTEQAGADNDRKALLRHTYLIAPSQFSLKKEVRYEGTAEFFERNRYSWKR
jgi:hypothetical protein